MATFFQSESKANLPKSARFFSERKLCNTMALWLMCDWILATNVIIIHREANSQVCLEGQCIVICCLEYLWHCAFSMDAPSGAFVITDIGGYLRYWHVIHMCIKLNQTGISIFALAVKWLVAKFDNINQSNHYQMLAYQIYICIYWSARFQTSETAADVVWLERWDYTVYFFLVLKNFVVGLAR